MAFDIAFTAGLDDKAFKDGLSRLQSESSRTAARVAQTIESQVGGYRKLAGQITSTVGAVTSLLGVAGLIAGAVWGAVAAGQALYEWFEKTNRQSAELRLTLDDTLRSIAAGNDPGLGPLLQQMEEANQRVLRLQQEINQLGSVRFGRGASELTLYASELRKQLDDAMRQQARARENLERRQRELERKTAEEAAREQEKRDRETIDRWYDYYMRTIRRVAEERRRMEEQLARHWQRVFEDRTDRLYRRAMQWVDHIIAQRENAPSAPPRPNVTSFSSGLSTAPRLIARAIGSGPDPAASAASAAAARTEMLMRQLADNIDKVRKKLEGPIMLEVGP